MKAREAWVLLAAAVAIGASGWWLHQNESVQNAPKSRIQEPFWMPVRPDEMQTFLAAMVAAEAMSDPLQRCLAFPDPPRSHWSRGTVEAYCRYTARPFMSKADALALIDRGHADALDRQLAELQRAQQSESDSRGQLDRTILNDFEDASAAMRHALDAWKLQSPKSAFAFAASGAAFVAAAGEARGNAFANETPAKNFDAMNKLLVLARADLETAVALDPHVTAAYPEMIWAGTMGSDEAYAVNATRHGFAVDPANFMIYARLMTMAEPKWDGSHAAMVHVATDALLHADKNPLLRLFQPEPAAYAAKITSCDCKTPRNFGDEPRGFAIFETVFDQPARSDILAAAGDAALAGEPDNISDLTVEDTAAIYLAEALRFNPRRTDDRITLIRDLSQMPRYAKAALVEANRAVAMAPKDGAAYLARAHLYEVSGDYEHAEQDDQAALSLAPDDAQTLGQLGNLYVESTHEWDKGWDVANRMIKAHPDDPTGWILRASIQKQQPRPGESETAEYIVQHFSTDPRARGAIEMARRIAGHDGPHQ